DRPVSWVSGGRLSRPDTPGNLNPNRFPAARAPTFRNPPMRFCLSVALTFVTSIPLIAADNWPAYRGPNGDGTSDAQNIPIKWSETENVRWKTAIHGKGWSSPVVWGDQVWVTTADEEGVDPKAPVPKSGGAIGAVDRVTFFAVCIDRKSGKVVHDI